LPTSVTSRGEIKGFVSVEYDNNYRIRSQSINGGNTINFSYDNDGLLTQVVDPAVGGTGLTITREPATGRISGTTLGNVTTIQSYNTLGELAGYVANYNSSPIFQTAYQSDSLGRITQINEIVQGISEKKNYEYDIAGRLWKVWRNDTLISTYSYDPNGNRIAHITPTSADSGSYDSQDRLLKYSNSQYLYTPNGELRLKIEGTDTTHYTYDYFGNLTKVIMSNGDRIDYIINGQNRRIGKKVNGGIVKKWKYSGQLTPVAELDSAGNVIARFAGGYMIKGSNTYQLITDHLGSVRIIIDASTGDVAQKIDYDEYGNIISDSNPDFQPFTYAGGLYDTQTKLVRFGARDYNASIGRWTSKDPIGFSGKDANLYQYCSDEPINNIDIAGLKVSCIYFQCSGDMICTDDCTGAIVVDTKSYSGWGAGLNNPRFQNIENAGPIPSGTWEIGEGYEGDKGDPQFDLTPTEGNDVFNAPNRKPYTFLIHADNPKKNYTASEGCIILPKKDRQTIKNLGGGTVRVARCDGPL